ncbi:sugar kinase [Shimia sp. R10_1]|uniref:sugar kinase n=1 Tax=Shimia sp. R10_1 TaxID=2821095 RepID=UPI001ADD0BCA|nr:sugar kinase [Shimia sp. R10_1]MBO9474308.1 sugar kinase [Shimia sp. R10_1]
MPTKNHPFRSIACVGEVMIELAMEGANHAHVGVAGDTFNTAYYLRTLLSETETKISYVTALGDDAFSDRIRATITSHGIKTDCIEIRAGQMPGLYAIQTDLAGERSFSYWRSASAARTLFAEPCHVPLSTLRNFDMIFLSGISMAILPPDTRTHILNWIDTYRANGGVVAYDSNHRARLWESAAAARHVNAEMWKRTDIALPSLDDEMELFEDVTEDAVVKRIRGYGVTSGALKRGAQGPCDILSGAPCAQSAPAVTMIDSTAAGDSFNAGYLAAICKGETHQDAMELGHKIAAHVVTQPGAIVDIAPKIA